MRIIIIGAGGHGQVVADIFRERARTGAAERVIGYIDGRLPADGTVLAGASVLGTRASMSGFPHDAVIVAIGDNATRARLSRELEDLETFALAIHPTAILSTELQIEAGTMICAGAIVNTGTAIGRGVILNTACSVDHHSRIGDFAHIAPGVHMGGEVSVGEGAFVGIGATVLPQISIGAWSIVGAGAVVTRPVAPGTTVVGCPAMPIKVSSTRRS